MAPSVSATRRTVLKNVGVGAFTRLISSSLNFMVNCFYCMVFGLFFDHSRHGPGRPPSPWRAARLLGYDDLAGILAVGGPHTVAVPHKHPGFQLIPRKCGGQFQRQDALLAGCLLINAEEGLVLVVHQRND